MFASEDCAFGLSVLRSVVSFFSDLSVEFEETNLLRIFFCIDKLRNFQEVFIVDTKELILDSCLVNQLSLSTVTLEDLGQLVASIVVYKV